MILFRLAYTFGSTSPKSKIKKVTKTTSTTNFKTGDAMVENNLSSEKEKSNTIAMCKKLFATNIVANNFLGFASKFSTTLDWLGCCVDKSFKFCDDNENKATSAAATIAQQKSKTAIPIIPKIISVFTVAKNVELESKSKIKKLVKQYQKGKSLIGLSF